MYSRNFTTNNSYNSVRLTPASEKNMQPHGNVPVKSFSDSFAYERFNKMGTQNSTDNDINTVGAVEETDNHEAMMVPHEKIEQDEQLVGSVGEIPLDKTVTSVFSKLRNIFDSDTILIILAAAILLFSENTTNDKLTPLALLAILFL